MALIFDETSEEKGPVKEEPSTPPPPPSSMMRQGLKYVAERARPYFEGTGAVVGGAIALPAAAASGPFAPAVEAGGVAGGYFTGAQAASALEEFAGVKPAPSLVNKLAEVGQDVKAGLYTGFGGPIASKAIGGTINVLGKVAKPVLGRWGGAGSGGVEAAIESGKQLRGPNVFKTQTDFDRALRQKPGFSKEDVVDSFRSAATELAEQRSKGYTSKLEELMKPQAAPLGQTGQIPAPMRKFLTLEPIKKKSGELANKFRVRQVGDSYDFSRSQLRYNGQPEAEEALRRVAEHGNQLTRVKELTKSLTGLKESVAKEADPAKQAELQKVVTKIEEQISHLRKQYAFDRSPVGLDMLKRHLDGLYSRSNGPAKALIADMRSTVEEEIVKSVPKYREMTQGYKEATELIKDVERAFSTSREGKSGAELAMKKIISSMKDNAEMRRDLIKIMSRKTGEDLTGQAGGAAMSDLLPKSNLVLFGETVAAWKWVDPKFWPLLAASSPRVQGEFLRLFGKGLQQMTGASKIAGTAAAMVGAESKKVDYSGMTDEEIKQELARALGFGK